MKEGRKPEYLKKTLDDEHGWTDGYVALRPQCGKCLTETLALHPSLPLVWQSPPPPPPPPDRLRAEQVILK